MTVQLKSPQPSKDAVYYPESDGKPMAESDLHREIMVYISRRPARRVVVGAGRR